MIKIERRECPERLSRGEAWNDRNCKSELVKALHEMQHGKCCYCERRIAEEGHDQAIEHFRPKSRPEFAHLENDWSNLLHACSCCNGKKASKFPMDEQGNPLLLNPTDTYIDPEDHFDFTVDFEDVNFGRIYPRDNSVRARATIETIGLDRIALRRERTRDFIRLLDAYIHIRHAPDETTRKQKIEAFENMLLANNEHAAFARAFARKKSLDRDFGVRIPEGAETSR